MPIPTSARGNQITGSPFEAPFETPTIPLGVGGIDLVSPVDRIAPGRFSRFTNLLLRPSAPGGLTARPGLDELVTGTGNFHTCTRFSDPEASTSTYLWGVGTTAAIGASGAVTVVDTGFSGDPLTLLDYHPPLSGDPWVYIGDTSQMRKVRFDGLSLPMALPAPTVTPVTTLGTLQTTPVASFSSADGTQAATWTGNKGSSKHHRTGSGAAVGINAADSLVNGTPAVEFTVTPPSGLLTEEITYFGFWGHAKTANLNLVGALPASDSDAIHVLLAMTSPQYVTEARIYFVCSPVFSATVLPGTVPGAAAPPGTTVSNGDFYVKAFRADDFAAFIIPGSGSTAGAADARVKSVEIDALDQSAARSGFDAVTGHAVQRVDTTFLQTQDPTRAATVQAVGASKQATEFGTVGISLRRGDFRRYGSLPGCDWSTVTGVIVYLSTTVPANVSAEPAIGVVLYVAGLDLRGGNGPDTMSPATQSYDYRYTNYDPRTGDESNPSPTQPDTAFLDSVRTDIAVTPAAYGDANLRQRFYRRGGVLVGDWYYAGVNTADGGVLTDTLSDLEIAAAGTLALDNYEPVPTVDDAGNTVLAQPVPVILGPVEGQLFALGDPHRPGTVYASKPGEPDHWPPDLRCEVCSPGEELMTGVLYGGQILLFSRTAAYFLYPNLLGARGMTSAPAGCTRGLAGRWAVCTGGGQIWGVATDGVFVTNGGPEEIVSDDIAPLFRGQTVNGYAPINLTIERNLRLSYFQRELHFVYEDTNNVQQEWVFTPETKQWRHYLFADNVVNVYADEVANQLIYGLADRASVAGGFADNGVAIAVTARTGAWDWGRPREEKLFGDQFLDVDPQGVQITLQNYVNADTITNAAQLVPVATGRQRMIFDSFGEVPQKGRTLSVELTWSSDSAAPIAYQVGTAITPQPDITINRPTNWDDLSHPDESYVMGVTLDANTGGEDRTVLIERDWQGGISTIATLTVNHDGRSKKKYSWPAAQANQVRIHPDNTCGAWMLFRADWIAKPEPPRIATWDSYFENAWDQYITGLDLYCDTEGETKELVVQVDGVTILNPATGLGFFPVTAAGRQVVHLTLPTIPPLRGHVLHFTAQDAFPGLLYDYRWQTVPEPSEQANWNQPFTILGTQSDKWVKAVIVEIDSFGEDKTVVIEADGVIVDTITVNADGRKVIQVAIPQQLGRVWRFLPTDHFPSRLYSLRLVFDEEPFALTRWETQELDHGMEGFFSITAMMITLKSSADVTLRISTYVNQTGTILTDDYVIPSTAGVKLKRQVQPLARKGVLYKYLLTCDESFWLYGDGTWFTLQPWGGGAAQYIHPIGDSDTDPTRRMINASIAAARDGGGT